MFSRFALLVLSCLFLAPVAANSLPPGQVPDALKPWIGWALWDQPERDCPEVPNAPGMRRCVWPGRLELDLDGQGGRFVLAAQAYAPGWLALPGDAEHWPLEVTADGQPALLETRDDKPGLRLSPGLHRIAGRYAWDRLPESLSIPDDTGLIVLTLVGKPVPLPNLNGMGALWINQEHAALAANAAKPTDSLALKVFRRINDGVPVQVLTRIELDVSGRSREVLLQGALLDQAVPLAVSGALPARLEPDGRLRVQVRPGHWPVEVTARWPGEVAALSLPENPAPWPTEEIWAYAADPAVRLVEVESVAPVDPRLAELPEAWLELPAYRLEPGAAMTFKQLRRGDPEPEPGALNLKRRLWLDFDGGGYTAQDQISGRMTHEWRLNAGPDLALGRVSVAGAPQSITRDPQGGVGVEVRRGALDLSADGRLEGRRTLSATGWNQDFREASTELNLPPGWRLLAALGVDSAPGAWTEEWTLLDLFMVLIAALAVAKLWNWGWGALALACLGLLWHEPDAPHTVWLHLLAATALLRNLPAGRLASAAYAYQKLALLALALTALPFMADQIRHGFYPQLQNPGALPEFLPAAAPQSAPELAEEAPQSAGEYAQDYQDQAGQARRDLAQKHLGAGKAAPPKPKVVLPQWLATDPKAITQTGPGLPQWQWTRIELAWNGPVPHGQTFRLVLLPPAANLALNLLGVALLLALAWRLSSGKPDFPGYSGFSWRRPGPASTALLLMMLPTLLCPPETKAENYPAPELLETLRQRLTAPPDCQPQCVDIPLLRLETSPAELRQTLEIHAQARTMLPLPARLGQWLPSKAELDGQPATALIRDEANLLWLAVEPGRHTLALSGPLPPREQVQIPLPLKARRAESSGTGWQVEGIHDGVPDGQLQLIRQAQEGQPPEALSALEAQPLPPFLEVRRTLRLGLDWRVNTELQRRSPWDSPVTAEIPLLPGEAVLTDGVRVKDGKAQINLLPGQTRLVWESALEKRPDIRLQAPAVQSWTEVWQADVSPVWHLRAEGLAVVHHQSPEGRWLPEWRPWPGEVVNLHLTRPEAVPGNTLTVDSSELRYTLGHRASDASLSLKLRSSQGGRHELRLPEAVALQAVLIDGAAQPIRQQGRVVSLPIHPGEQTIVLNWRSDNGIFAYWRAPELDLDAPSVNASTHISLGHDRWVLLLGGPTLGPAVLFWGMLALILALAFGLGRAPLSPLKAWQWGLLLVGLSQISAAGGLVVAGWLFALAWREQSGSQLSDRSFNTLQIGLALLTVLALAALLEAVQQGLLGLPSMQVAGNSSDAYNLNWYQDRAEPIPPRPWIISAPLWSYRALMLAWALWLAYSLLDWLRWGFRAYVADGLWRIKPKAEKAEKPADPPMVEQEER